MRIMLKMRRNISRSFLTFQALFSSLTSRSFQIKIALLHFKNIFSYILYSANNIMDASFWYWNFKPEFLSAVKPHELPITSLFEV